MGRRRDPYLHDFYEPFYETGSGQILMLSVPKGHIRDGLAAVLIARHFPLPDFPAISIEPSRSTLQPSENLIIVGWSDLFIEREVAGISGEKPVGIGYSKLGHRLEGIDRDCCYAFSGEPRLILNRLTGDTYAAEDRTDLGKRLDYGVIRRVFRDESENTVLLEGIHGLGTLGAAKVATTPSYLAAIRKAVATIEDYDPSRSLEVLVRSTFDPSLHQEVYAPEAIVTEIVNIVYDGTGIYDKKRRVWLDHEPYDLVLEAGPGISWPFARKRDDGKGPLLEVTADLRALDAETREMCRKQLSGYSDDIGGPARSHNGLRQTLLSRLTMASDLFRLCLHDVDRHGPRGRIVLPKGGSEIRLLRKQYLVHLILCHFLGTRLRCSDAYLRRHLPEVSRRARKHGRSASKEFIATVHGRMREGFLSLLGETGAPKQYLTLLRDPADRTYRLRLQFLRIEARLRL